MSSKFKFTRNSFETILQLNAFSNIKGWTFSKNEDNSIECKIISTNNFDDIHPIELVTNNLYTIETFVNNYDNHNELQDFFRHPNGSTGSNGSNVDFYYLNKSDYLFAMSSNPTDIYISFAVIDMGASLMNDPSGSSNHTYYIMKLEMVRNGMIQYVSLSGVETPLYLLAPPCPPVWRSRSIYNAVTTNYPNVRVRNTSNRT